MVVLILKDNDTDEVVITLKTSMALLPKDNGVPFSLVEFPDLEQQIKSGKIEEGDVTETLKDLNYNLKKSTTVTLAQLRVIADRNDLSIFTEDGETVGTELPVTTTTTTTSTTTTTTTTQGG